MDHYISRIRRLLKHTSSQYEYQQLRGDRSFRVLELLPAEKLGAQLICCIKEVDLDGYENKYEALSYVWGIPTPVQKLRSDCGQTFQITPNCASALRHLRLKSEIRTLWLDSICINQSSNDEKAHQIAMMSDIYKNAREVLVWLGEGDSSNAFIFKEYKLVAELIQAGSLRNPLETEGPPASRDEMLHDLPGRLGELLRPLNPTMVSQPSDLTLKRSLHSHLHIFGRAPGDPTTTARTSTSNLFLKNIEFLDKMEMTLRECCIRLAHNEYFRRVWTVQEIAFAKSIQVHVGEEIIPWTTFTAAVQFFFLQGPTFIEAADPLELSLEAWRTQFSGLEAHFVLSSQKTVENQRVLNNNNIDLAPLLMQLRRLEATNPRDKIFAIVPLLARGKLYIPTTDYAKIVPQVFVDFTAALLTDTWGPLFLANGKKTYSMLPSWVPDWSKSLDSPIEDFAECLMERVSSLLITSYRAIRFLAEDDQPSTEPYMFNPYQTATRGGYKVVDNGLEVDGTLISIITERIELKGPSGKTTLDKLSRLVLLLAFLKEFVDMTGISPLHNITWVQLLRYGIYDDGFFTTKNRIHYKTFIDILLPQEFMEENQNPSLSMWMDMAFGLLKTDISQDALAIIARRFTEELDAVSQNLQQDNESEHILRVYSLMEALDGGLSIEHMFHWNSSFAFFKALDGRIGKASNDLRFGDIVFAMDGIPCPMIIRQAAQIEEGRSANHVLIGPAYILGAMEAWISVQLPFLSGYTRRKIKLI